MRVAGLALVVVGCSNATPAEITEPAPAPVEDFSAPSVNVGAPAVATRRTSDTSASSANVETVGDSVVHTRVNLPEATAEEAEQSEQRHAVSREAFLALVDQIERAQQDADTAAPETAVPTAAINDDLVRTAASPTREWPADTTCVTAEIMYDDLVLVHGPNAPLCALEAAAAERPSLSPFLSPLRFDVARTGLGTVTCVEEAVNCEQGTVVQVTYLESSESFFSAGALSSYTAQVCPTPAVPIVQQPFTIVGNDGIYSTTHCEWATSDSEGHHLAVELSQLVGDPGGSLTLTLTSLVDIAAPSLISNVRNGP